LNKKIKIKNGGYKKGSSIVELIIVTVLLAIFVPTATELFISAKKINGQAYIQHSAAVTLGETNDILRYMRNQGFDFLINGSFYLIRNPGTGAWLVKNDLPTLDTFERYITISNALRHQDTNDLYFDGDTGVSYEDSDTKKIVIQILWAPDYIPMEQTTQIIYVTNWLKSITYNS
jgi:hypothetical protein